MMRAQILHRLYQALSRLVISPAILRFGFQGKRDSIKSFAIEKNHIQFKKIIWFHAASVGELEILWTCIERCAQEGCGLVLTVFSGSARRQVEKLAQEIHDQHQCVLAYGMSPLEGYWKEEIQKYPIDTFVTAKYEAWPDLWTSLAILEIPLVIVGAQWRSSLKWAKRMCLSLVGTLPQITLLTIRSSDRDPLATRLAHVHFKETGDPRWDRVHRRNQNRNPRVQELINIFSEWPRPWGILGSVWMSDLNWLNEKLRDPGGTLWFVPHVVSEDAITEIEAWLSAQGYTWIRTTRIKDKTKKGLTPMDVVLVDEMGFLSELYASADWAFVGGGFGSVSLHSTIEPAINGIPVLAGPKGWQRFSEISGLRESGQLTLLEEPEAWTRFIERFSSSKQESDRAQWKSSLKALLGATDRVVDSILKAGISH